MSMSQIRKNRPFIFPSTHKNLVWLKQNSQFPVCAWYLPPIRVGQEKCLSSASSNPRKRLRQPRVSSNIPERRQCNRKTKRFCTFLGFQSLLSWAWVRWGGYRQWRHEGLWRAWQKWFLRQTLGPASQIWLIQSPPMEVLLKSKGIFTILSNHQQALVIEVNEKGPSSHVGLVEACIHCPSRKL